jgi:DNA-binding winged helix-turn-helix (wHTH) protein
VALSTILHSVAPMQHFPPFRFDPAEGTLWRGDSPIPLTGKAVALLRCLLAHAGTWVSKSTIMAAVWPDTHVQPENVKVLVREIRQALGDQPRAATYIRSAPGRGYCFIAPISEGTAGGAVDLRVGSKPPIFVNRGPELATLADALDAARASARRFVLVVGEHGLGKTALCDAFIRTATAAGPVRVSYGQCFNRQLPQEPYYPFLDALVRLDRRHPSFVPSILAQHAPSWLAQFPQWLGARAVPVHAVRMFDELCAALDAVSHDQPLILVLEDVQWADADTVSALARLARSHVPAKLLIVGTCCDGEWTAGDRARNRLLAAAEVMPCSATLMLGPLTLELVRRYLDARFGPDCMSELAPAVHEATGGNPFMMVTAIDSLVARRLIVEDGGRWKREAPLATIARAFPETLGEAIARQVDHLDAREREVLEAAAVVGVEFTAASVAFALQRRIEQVRSLLGPLARRGQLIVTAGHAGSHRSAHATYRFRHGLYAEVIGERAPMLRQLKIAERLNHAGTAALRRA